MSGLPNEVWERYHKADKDGLIEVLSKALEAAGHDIPDSVREDLIVVAMVHGFRDGQQLLRRQAVLKLTGAEIVALGIEIAADGEVISGW